jgi:hypothetical protein
VERRSDPSDQRILRVHPTEAALALKGRLEADWRQFEAQLSTGLTDDDLSTLSGLLARVLANLTALDAGEGPPPCLVEMGKDNELAKDSPLNENEVKA